MFFQTFPINVITTFSIKNAIVSLLPTTSQNVIRIIRKKFITYLINELNFEAQEDTNSYNKIIVKLPIDGFWLMIDTNFVDYIQVYLNIENLNTNVMLVYKEKLWLDRYEYDITSSPFHIPRPEIEYVRKDKVISYLKPITYKMANKIFKILYENTSTHCFLNLQKEYLMHKRSYGNWNIAIGVGPNGEIVSNNMSQETKYNEKCKMYENGMKLVHNYVSSNLKNLPLIPEMINIVLEFFGFDI